MVRRLPASTQPSKERNILRPRSFEPDFSQADWHNDDRLNHLALPHRREAGRRDGSGLQGRGHRTWALRRPEVPPRWPKTRRHWLVFQGDSTLLAIDGSAAIRSAAIACHCISGIRNLCKSVVQQKFFTCRDAPPAEEEDAVTNLLRAHIGITRMVDILGTTAGRAINGPISISP